MKNANDLIKKSSSIIEDIENGKLNHKSAREMNSAILNIIKIAKVQLEYSALRKEKPEIEFLNNEEK